MSEPRKKFEQLALRITHWIGSPLSVALHTLAFILSFATVYSGLLSLDRMLLVLTTIVSLEAIYLSLFIQMTVNYQAQSLEGVEQDIDEIQEDIDEIQEDVDEIQEDVEEMSEEDAIEAERDAREGRTLEQIHEGLQKLMQDIERLQQKQ
jgi:low affinity Fe/Cu permease